MKAIVVGALLAVSSAPVARGQTQARWTVEALAGAGRHTERAGETYYFADETAMIRLATTFAPRPDGRLVPFLAAELSMSANGDRVSFCAFAPNGSCKKYFAENDGVGASIGLRMRPASWIALSIAGGGGGYSHQLRTFTDAQAAVRIVPHVEILGNARYMRWTSGGQPYWYAPVSVGIAFY